MYFGKQTGTALGYPSFFTTSVPRGSPLVWAMLNDEQLGSSLFALAEV